MVHYYNPGQHWRRMGITFPSPSSLPTYNADIAGGVENKFSVPCTEIMGTHLQLFFGSVKIHGNPFLIIIIIDFNKHLVNTLKQSFSVYFV